MNLFRGNQLVVLVACQLCDSDTLAQPGLPGGCATNSGSFSCESSGCKRGERKKSCFLDDRGWVGAKSRLLFKSFQ